MFDDITFASRHGDDADPLLAMLAERERFLALARHAYEARDEKLSALPGGMKPWGVTIDFPGNGPRCFYSENEVERAIKDRRWHRNAEAAIDAFLKSERGDKFREELRQIEPTPRPEPEDDATFAKNNAAALEHFRDGMAKIAAARDAVGYTALDRQGDEFDRQYGEAEDRICETQATTRAGMLGQLNLLQCLLEQDDQPRAEKLIGSIIAGVKHLVAGPPEPTTA